MEHTKNNRNNVEFDLGVSAYRNAHIFRFNFELVREDNYREALPLYCRAITHFERAKTTCTVEEAEKITTKIEECFKQADPKNWSLQSIPEGIDEALLPESFKSYLKQQNKPVIILPPLPLESIEERIRRHTLGHSPKTPSPSSSERSSPSAGNSERSNSDGESSSRSLRKQISKYFHGKLSPSKLSPLRPASVEKERPSSLPEKSSLLQKSTKMKDLKTLLQTEEDKNSLRPPAPTTSDTKKTEDASSESSFTEERYKNGMNLAKQADEIYRTHHAHIDDTIRTEKYIACVNIACAAALNFLLAYDKGEKDGLERAIKVLETVNELKNWKINIMPVEVRDLLWFGLWRKIGERCAKNGTNYTYWKCKSPR